jgi:hypothetical protein
LKLRFTSGNWRNCGRNEGAYELAPNLSVREDQSFRNGWTINLMLAIVTNGFWKTEQPIGLLKSRLGNQPILQAAVISPDVGLVWMDPLIAIDKNERPCSSQCG